MVESRDATTPAGAETLQLLLSELKYTSQAEVAGQLAALAGDAAVRTQLLLRQADLFDMVPNRPEAAAIYWKLYGAHQLPPERLERACLEFAAAEQSDRRIALAEERLRAGISFSQEVLDGLGDAYEQTGRFRDAALACSNHRDVPPVSAVRPDRGRGSGGVDPLGRTGGGGFFSVPSDDHSVSRARVAASNSA